MKSLLLLLFSLYSICGNSQYKAEKFDAALLEAKYGAMLIYNGEKNSFTLRFVSKSFKPTDQPNFVRVDGYLMQSTILAFQQKFDFSNATEEAQKKFLLGWKEYERSWLEEQLKNKVKDQAEFIKIKEKLFLHWITDMPKGHGDGSVVNQVYLVTACFDQLLILNAPVLKDQKDKEVTDKLSEVASTLELKPNAVQDINKLYTELKK